MGVGMDLGLVVPQGCSLSCVGSARSLIVRWSDGQMVTNIPLIDNDNMFMGGRSLIPSDMDELCSWQSSLQYPAVILQERLMD